MAAGAEELSGGSRGSRTGELALQASSCDMQRAQSVPPTPLWGAEVQITMLRPLVAARKAERPSSGAREQAAWKLAAAPRYRV